MAEIAFTIAAKDYGKFEKRLGAAFKPMIEDVLNDVSRQAIIELRRIGAKKRIEATGNFNRGWMARKVSWSHIVVYNVADYAMFVEHGRGPGKMPPAAKIRAWVLMKTGNADLVYPIQRAIGKRGIQPRPVLTSQAFRVRMKRVLHNSLRRGLDRALMKARR